MVGPVGCDCSASPLQARESCCRCLHPCEGCSCAAKSRTEAREGTGAHRAVHSQVAALTGDDARAVFFRRTPDSAPDTPPIPAPSVGSLSQHVCCASRLPRFHSLLEHRSQS
jgi:hypothetical protein